MQLIASYSLLEMEPIRDPEVPGEFLFDGQKPSQYVYRSYGDDFLQLINVTGCRDLS